MTQSQRPPVWAPYMKWAKSHPQATHDLTVSNLLACPVEQLPGAQEALALTGANNNGYEPLVEAIAARYGVAPEQVATANGASEANFLVLAALVRPGDEVLVERPAYDPLLGASRLLGARVRRFDRPFASGFALDPERVSQQLTPKTRLIVITNPHNPSGALASVESLDEVARLAETVGARVLVDEVYLDAAVGPVSRPAASRSGTLVSTSSLTKSYGLAGLRCGWVLAAPEVAEGVRRARDVVDAVGAFPAESLALIAFRHLDALAARARSILDPNRESLCGFVAARPELEWVSPRAGTVGFPRLGEVADCDGFVERLRRDYATGVVPGSFFEAPSHFRVAFGGPTETLAAGLTAIGRALDDRVWS